MVLESVAGVALEQSRVLVQRYGAEAPNVIATATCERPTDPVAELTEREREVLSLMAEGRSNHGIGAKLFLSPKTIETHIHQIFQKLGLQAAADDHRRVLAVLAYLSLNS